ncbi:MAG TPA: hypothetical protein DC049_09245 [Spirochaetia bacterium]|nr:hypothetical protein [Spirochaetia bacterium]
MFRKLMEAGENINSAVLNKKVLSEESLARAQQIHQSLNGLDNIAANRFSIKDIFEDYFCLLYPELLKTSQETGQVIVNTAVGLLRKIRTYDVIDFRKLSQIQDIITKSGSVNELINMLYLNSFLCLAPIENNALDINMITGKNVDKLKVDFANYVKYFFKILDNYIVANGLMEKNIVAISKDPDELTFKQNQIVSLRSNIVSAYSSFFGISCGMKKIIHYSKPPEGFPYRITQEDIEKIKNIKGYCEKDQYYREIQVGNIFDIMFNIYIELQKSPLVGGDLNDPVFDVPMEQKESLESQLVDAKIDFYERVVRPFVRRTPR